MLSENLRRLRKSKGLSQEELAVKVNVVRQTISKWEKGLSVPDSEMLIRLAEELDTTVSVLLGETAAPEQSDDIKVLSAKLELLNEQFAKQNEKRRRIWRAVFFAIGIMAVGMLLQELLMMILTWIAIGSFDDASIGIIGGADGPTSILVASTASPVSKWILALAAAALAGAGLYATRKK